VARLVLLLSSPRVAPGLLSRDAWTTLARAVAVLAGDADEPTCAAIADSGIAVHHLGAIEPLPLARLLLDRADPSTPPQGTVGAGSGEAGDVVYIGSDDGDPGLTDALAAEVSRRTDPVDIEVLVGSHDVPGSRLLDLVAVMDRLRSPGGCPWDAQQTHESLARYLLEEAHEAVEAIESGDRPHLVEELGDVLLQVAFHSRIGQEDPRDSFDIDDVAAGIVAKLVRRHPHVFAGGSAGTAGEVQASWEQIKAAEKPERSSVFDGIPAGLPALARAAKVLARLERTPSAGVVRAVLQQDPGSVGTRLLALVGEAGAGGEDPEAALRRALRVVEQAVAASGPDTSG